jgi:hypothetical protein
MLGRSVERPASFGLIDRKEGSQRRTYVDARVPIDLTAHISRFARKGFVISRTFLPRGQESPSAISFGIGFAHPFKPASAWLELVDD